MKQKKSYLIILLLYFFVFYFSSCSLKAPWSEDNENVVKIPPKAPDSTYKGNTAINYLNMPWKFWINGRDLQGAPLQNGYLLLGDEYIAMGNGKKALEILLKVNINDLSPNELSAYIVRLASLYLEFGKAEEALLVLSDYFKKNGAMEESVPPQFALLFGYAYGAINDIPQALAWFSKAYTQSLFIGDGAIAYKAEQGLNLLLKTIPQERLIELSEQFNQDTFIKQNIAKVRVKIVRGEFPLTARRGKFWGHFRNAQNYQQESSINSKNSYYPSNTVSNFNKIVVAVLLPLSGKFRFLGESAQKGIELALVGQNASNFIVLKYRDTKGEAEIAQDQAREAIFTDGAKFIIGPIISDAAESALAVAKRYNISMLSLSKRSGFPAQAGFYRFGATVENQVESLVAGIVNLKIKKRFSVIYPQDDLGEYIANKFEEAMISEGIRLDYKGGYFPHEKGALVAVADDIEARKLTFVLFAGDIDEGIKLMTNITPYKRKIITFAGLANWFIPSKLRRASKALEGAIVLSPYNPYSKRDLVVKFKNAYKAKWGQEANYFSAQGFDAGTIVFASMKESRERGISLSESFESIASYEGVTGVVYYAGNGEFKTEFVLTQIQGGEIVEIYPLRVEVLDKAGQKGLAKHLN